MSFAAFLLYVFVTFIRPIELFAPDLAEYRPMLWLWIVAFVLGLARLLFRWEVAAQGRHLLLLAAFCGVIVVSVVANGWIGGAVDAAGDFSPSAMLFVLVAMNATTARKLRSTCITVVAALVLAAACAVVAYHTGWHAEQLVLAQTVDSDDDDVEAPAAVAEVPADDTSGRYLWRVRGLGFLNDPNDFAQAIVMVLPMLWIFVQRERVWRSLMFALAPSLLLGYTILLTHSRGAVLGVASLLLFGMRKLLGGVRMALLAVGLGFVAVSARSGDAREFSSSEASAEGRIDAWRAGLQMLKSHPTFGVGAGNFTDHHPALTAHNSFVLCFAELGLAGYFLWIALLVSAYKGLGHTIERSPRSTDEHRHAALLRASLVGFLTCAWFLSRTYQPALYFIVALCVAAACIAAPRGQRSAQPVPAVPWARDSVLAMVASMAAVYAFVAAHDAFGR
jgi:putative inorganic carbon (HCO3(-)) transporter